MPHKVLHDFTFFGKKYRAGTILPDDLFTPGQFAGFAQFGRTQPVESLDKELQRHTVPELQTIAEKQNIDVHGLKKDQIIQAIIDNDPLYPNEVPIEETPDMSEPVVEEDPGTE